MNLVMKRWHGTPRSDMPSFLFVLNSVTMPPQHTKNFSRPLEMMQCSKQKPFAGKKKMFSEGRILLESEQRSG